MGGGGERLNAALEDDLRWLYSLENIGIKLGLSNTRGLLRALGDPQEGFSSFHIGGSNGKGSVSSMLASISRCAGLRTGLYTSPHLVRFSERMTVNGKEMSEAELSKLISEVREVVDRAGTQRPLTFFEITTAMAFLHFADSGVEVAVVEVGMGGRLDATNVIRPVGCAITPISLEHTAYLGDTIAKIAYEKASIIKEGVPVISSPQPAHAAEVISWMADCRGSHLRTLGQDFRAECVQRDAKGVTAHLSTLGSEVRVGMPGRFQCHNAAVAAECALAGGKGLGISKEHIISGLAEVRWPGRLDAVLERPLTVLDVTHTPDGARAIADELDLFQGSPRVLVVGMLSDKDAPGAMAHLASSFDLVICTSPRTPRALSSEDMLQAVRPFNTRCQKMDGVAEAVSEARRIAGEGGFVMVCGSLYTVGEAISYLGVGDGP